MGAARLILGCVLSLGLAVGAGAQQRMQIQFAEPVQIAARPGTTQFDAYGRRFTLDLESNDRLIRSLQVARKSTLSSVRLLRGTLTGVPGSWVRLTESAGRVEGAIWDGHDLYAVTRYAGIAQDLSTPLEAMDDQVVVFRLADTVNALPSRFCALDDRVGDVQKANGLDQYNALVGELRAQVAKAVVVNRQMDVALVADSQFQAQQGSSTAAVMLERLNIADGIYAEQLGLLLSASVVQLVPSSNDPFTTTDAGDLLSQLSNYRSDTPTVRSTALAHLITGKELDGDTLGIARRSGVCTVKEAVSLTQTFGGSFYSGLLMAHEFGHNLGAGHDGESGGACESAGSNYLMAPAFSGSARLSQCSIDAMRPVIDSAVCLTPAAAADVTVSLAGEPGAIYLGTPHTLTATVNSSGTLPITNATLDLSLPTMAWVTDAVPSSGSCTVGNSVVCSLGDIAAGETRTVTLTLVPTQTSIQTTVNASVSASNDRVANNNSAYLTFAVINNADARVSVAPSAITARTGDAVEYTIRVESVRIAPVRGVTLSSGYPPGLQDFTFTPSVGTCTIYGDCTLGDLAPGAVATIVVRGTAFIVGTWSQDIRLSAFNESEGNDNVARLSITVEPRFNLAVSGNMNQPIITTGQTLVSEFLVRNTDGTQPVTNAALRVMGDGTASIQGVTVPGGTCAVESAFVATCTLGDMPLGDSRAIAVTLLGTRIGGGRITVRASGDLDEKSADNEWSNNFTVRNPVDLRVSPAYWVERVEGVLAYDEVPVYSFSSMAATAFMATIEMPPESTLSSLSMPDTACVVIDARHGQCTAATLEHSSQRSMRVGAIGNVPGAFPVRVTISATSDFDTSDNAAEFNLNVGAYTDVGIDAPTLPEYFFMGRPYELVTRVRTDRRPVAGVVLSISLGEGLSMLLPTGLNCTTRVLSPSGLAYDCAMGNLAANTNMELRIPLQTDEPALGGNVYLSVVTTRDVDQSNNFRQHYYRVVEPSDLELRVASASISATLGQSFKFPRITVRSPHDAHDVLLRIPVPAFTKVKNVSTDGSPICTGTAVLECRFMYILANEEKTIDIDLDTLAAGSGSSAVTIASPNDLEASNNSATVAVTVGAVAKPPASGGSSSGGGGGGGRVEWAMLAALALMAGRRARRRASHAATARIPCRL